MQTRLTLFVRNTCEHSGNNYVLVNLLCDLLEIVTLVSFSRVSLVSTCFVPRSKTARMYPFINTQNKLYSLILFFQTCGSCSYSLFPQCHIRTIGNGCIHVKRPRNWNQPSQITAKTSHVWIVVNIFNRCSQYIRTLWSMYKLQRMCVSGHGLPTTWWTNDSIKPGNPLTLWTNVIHWRI